MLTKLGITVKAEPHLIHSSAFNDNKLHLCRLTAVGISNIHAPAVIASVPFQGCNTAFSGGCANVISFRGAIS